MKILSKKAYEQKELYNLVCKYLKIASIKANEYQPTSTEKVLKKHEKKTMWVRVSKVITY